MWREQMHVAGADDELRAPVCKPIRHRAVTFLSRRVVVELEDTRRDPGGAGSLEGVRAADVRGDRDDWETGIEQRLQVRAAPGNEYADHASSAQTTPSIPSSSLPMIGN